MIGLEYFLTFLLAYSAKYIPEKRPIGTATIIAIKAINAVPANKGTDPKASLSSLYSSGVIVAASLTNALCGLHEVPNKKSNILIVVKNLILSNKSEKIIPIVVSIATKEHVKRTALKIFSTSSLALLLFINLLIIRSKHEKFSNCFFPCKRGEA